MDRDEIIAANPILPFLEGRGCMIRAGKTNRCALVEHKPMHCCVSIDLDRNLWNCHDCETGGSVIDWLMKEHDITAQAAMERLGGTNGHSRPQNAPQPVQRATNGTPATNGARPKLAKTYDYIDAGGELVFQVCRLEPKDFRQRRKVEGQWVWDLKGIVRVLYNLPKVISADMVFLCEGEKDADTLSSMAFIATTNCGGAKKWESQYTAYFRGKEIVILPDNDPAGQEHLELLRKNLSNVVKSMRIVQMPEGVKDVSDFVATFPTTEDARQELLTMCEAAECLHKGQSVPVQTMQEMEKDYEVYIKNIGKLQFSLGDWLPSFRQWVRPIVPGELVMILASTGTGKTAILQNIALTTKLETILFEKELPNVLTFERFVGIATKSSGAHVESTYRMGGKKDFGGRLNHIVCCHERLSPSGIEKVIENTALKTNARPVLVLVDYVQLISGEGGRYERTSDAAEELKAVAKKTNTIIITASQVGRKEKKKDGDEASREVRLNDGKDSGAIENSSGLVLGAWRDAKDEDRMWIRVLKNTKGRPGKTIPCRINETLCIVEESTAEEPNP